MKSAGCTWDEVRDDLELSVRLAWVKSWHAILGASLSSDEYSIIATSSPPGGRLYADMAPSRGSLTVKELECHLAVFNQMVGQLKRH